jgi:hypothetical protein
MSPAHTVERPLWRVAINCVLCDLCGFHLLLAVKAPRNYRGVPTYLGCGKLLCQSFVHVGKVNRSLPGKSREAHHFAPFQSFAVSRCSVQNIPNQRLQKYLCELYYRRTLCPVRASTYDYPNTITITELFVQFYQLRKLRHSDHHLKCRTPTIAKSTPIQGRLTARLATGNVPWRPRL